MAGKLLNIVDQGSVDSGSVDRDCVGQDSTARLTGPAPGGPKLEFRGRAAVVTLGCAKNQVDSELILGALRRRGYEVTTDLSRADVAVVNTCGFLESATKESIDAVLEAASWKKQGRLRRLIMAGCVVERYKEDLRKTLPEVDAFMRVDELVRAGEIADGEVVDHLGEAARPYFLYDDSMPRVLDERALSAYVKISDGCDRPCAFCTIPSIRGAMRSRNRDSILREVSDLGRSGVLEANLVAQDLTAWGEDRGERNVLAPLLRDIDRLAALPWLRLLYTYPLGITSELLAAISESRSVCKYLDIPLQHSSESILKAMRRPGGKFASRPLVEFIRRESPEIRIRTTFITGFPGEKERDVEDLAAFISEGHFSSVGVFTYSSEEGTPAAVMQDQLPQKEKDRRRALLMKAQQRVVTQNSASLLGSELDVLVEGPHPESEQLFQGRAAFQAPEVDGCVIVNDSEVELEQLTRGGMFRVRITEAAGYDLLGTAIAPLG